MPPKQARAASVAAECNIFLDEILEERAVQARPDPPPRFFTDPAGECALCDLPPAQHRRRPVAPVVPPPIGGLLPDPQLPAGPVVTFEQHVSAPSVFEFEAHLLPVGAVVPLVARDNLDTVDLVNYLHARASSSSAHMSSEWIVLNDDTVGPTPLVFDRCVRYALGALAGRLDRLAFTFMDVPEGRTQAEVARFHHRRGLALLAITQSRVRDEAARNVGVWRDVMTPSSSLETAAENICARIALQHVSTADAPVATLLPTSYRTASWWSCVWCRLQARSRADHYWAIVSSLLAAVARSEERNGRYMARSAWVTRFKSSPAGGERRHRSPSRLPTTGPPSPSAPADGHGGVQGPVGVVPRDRDPAGQRAPFGGRNSRRGRGGRRSGGGRFRSRGPVFASPVLPPSAVPTSRCVGFSFDASDAARSDAAADVADALSVLRPSLPEVPMPVPACLGVAPDCPTLDASLSSPIAGVPAATCSTLQETVPPPALLVAVPERVAVFATSAGSGTLFPPCSSVAQIVQTLRASPIPTLDVGTAACSSLLRHAPLASRSPPTATVGDLPAGSAVPDSDWEWEPLPGAFATAELIRHRTPRLDLRRYVAVVERRIRELPPGSSVESLETALADVTGFLDCDGRVHLDPRGRYVDVPLPPRAHGPGADDALHRLLADGSAILVMDGLSGLWFHRLFCVPKTGGGTRLISDLRQVNSRFDAPPGFRLPSVDSVFCGRYGTKLDLRSAFYQPPISRLLQRSFAFATPLGPAVYDGLPMGWSWSPYLFDLLLRPVDLYCRAAGLRIVRYVDDVALIADSPDELARDLASLLALLREAGWAVSLDKSYLVAARSFTFLGVAVDLGRAAVRWALAKFSSVLSDLRELLVNPVVSTLLRLVGRISFLLQTMPVFRCFLRGLSYDASRYADAPPASRIRLSVAARADAAFWLSAPGAEVARRWWPRPRAGRPLWTTSTDASETGVWWTPVLTPDGSSLAAPATGIALRADVAGKASACRELSAIDVLLGYLASPLREGPRLVEGDELCVTMDAQVCVHVLNDGCARAHDLVVEMQRVATLLLGLPPIFLSARWVSRDCNVDADAGSRLPDLAECRLAATSWARVLAWAGFTPLVDLFASPTNARAAAYCSLTPGLGCLALDGLRCAPRSHSYAFPPFALASRCVSLLYLYRQLGLPCVAVLPADLVRARFSVWPLHLTHIPSEPLLISPPPYVGPDIAPPQALGLVKTC